jgi:hypothetical protein
MRISRASPVPLVALVSAATLALLAACSGGNPGEKAARPQVSAAASPTALADFDTSSLSVRRAEFCESIPAAAVVRALGGTVTKSTSYINGEQAAIRPGLRDVAHEFSCAYSASNGARARAWVFAPPVTRTMARRVISGLRGNGRCRTPPSTAFGKPSLATICRSPAGTEAAYRGLFADAWLSCSITRERVAGQVSEAALLARAGAWCVEVAAAADASGG